MDRILAVISDLHVGEGVLDDFDAEIEAHFVSFLDWLGTQGMPAELVINGDFLDFVQATPWRGPELESTAEDGTPLCFTEQQSVDKFEAIRAAHPKALEALGRFVAAQDGNRLVVIPGNHDADFFWPRVGEAFLEAVGPASRVSILLSRVYRPDEWLWIEHGHQYDPVNAFFANGNEIWSAGDPPIKPDAKGTPRLYECIGTRFLIRFINRLDARYPLVDNVKPFSRFMKIFGASALRWGRGPLDAVIALAQMTAYLARTTVSRSGDLLSAAGDEPASANPLANWYRHALPRDRDTLRRILKEAGLKLQFDLEMALERPGETEKIIEILASQPETVAGLGGSEAGLLGAGPGTLALGAGFLGDETRDLRDGAKGVAARERVTTIVMGHTHEPVEDLNGYTYLNTGSWTRYYVFEDKEKTAPWRMLEKGSYERFPYHLRYALVKPGATAATLETWRERSKG